MAVTKIKGYNLKMSGLSIGKEVSCQATLTNNLEAAEYKGSTDEMNPDQEVTSKDWSMQQEVTELTTVSDLRTLISTAIGTATTSVSMSASGTSVISGKAWLNDLSIQATNRSASRATMQFQGTGAPTL